MTLNVLSLLTDKAKTQKRRNLAHRVECIIIMYVQYYEVISDVLQSQVIREYPATLVLVTQVTSCTHTHMHTLTLHTHSHMHTHAHTLTQYTKFVYQYTSIPNSFQSVLVSIHVAKQREALRQLQRRN